jgi:hypothetical protein
MGNFYLLDDNNNPYEVTLEEYIAHDPLYTKRERYTIGRDMFDNDVLVSTVFLGIDHNYAGMSDEPLLFETMILGGDYDDYCVRSTSWEKALQIHKETVQLINNQKTNDNGTI